MRDLKSYDSLYYNRRVSQIAIFCRLGGGQAAKEKKDGRILTVLWGDVDDLLQISIRLFEQTQRQGLSSKCGRRVDSSVHSDGLQLKKLSHWNL